MKTSRRSFFKLGALFAAAAAMPGKAFARVRGVVIGRRVAVSKTLPQWIGSEKPAYWVVKKVFVENGWDFASEEPASYRDQLPVSERRMDELLAVVNLAEKEEYDRHKHYRMNLIRLEREKDRKGEAA